MLLEGGWGREERQIHEIDEDEPAVMICLEQKIVHHDLLHYTELKWHTEFSP